MINIWIGDYHCNQLKQKYMIDTLKNTNKDPEDKADEYITADNANYSWFTTSARCRLDEVSVENCNVIIMLGLTDCIELCMYKALSVKQLVANYIDIIANLALKHSSYNFYVCSVNPINGGFSSSIATNGLISAKDLTNKIKDFNSRLYAKISYNLANDRDEIKNITYIDSFNYLNSTSFLTYDGIHYTEKTIENLYNFVLHTARISVRSNFVPRLSIPILVGDSEEAKYWRHTSSGGLNPYKRIQQWPPSDTDSSSSSSRATRAIQEYPSPPADSGVNSNWISLPNCTAWAWGRFYEILGTKPNLCVSYGGLHHAERWFGDTADGYTRGDTPALGAIVCWQKGELEEDQSDDDGAGHVAIVEQIHEDGSITVSHSGYGWAKLVLFTKLDNSNGNWGYPRPYKFQGFIYNPKVGGAAVSDYLLKASVVSKNGSLTEEEKCINARYIWQYFGNRGWTLNAVAGMLGNMWYESGISPNRCEASDLVRGPGVQPTYEEIKSYANRYLGAHKRFPGFGIVQWTGQYEYNSPNTWEYQKYIYWCNERELDPLDIDSQLERIIWEHDTGKQFYPRGAVPEFPMSFKEFAKSTKSAAYLAEVFLVNYENPSDQGSVTRFNRGTKAEEWYKYLLPYAPGAFSRPAIFNSKVDTLTSTSIKGSFLIKNCYYYKVYNKKTKQVIRTGIFRQPADNEDITTRDLQHLVLFNYNNLMPNTSYTLVIEARSSRDSDEKLQDIIVFKTPQAFPAPVKEPLFVYNREKNTFNLTITKPDDLGYWSSNGGGYDIVLLINGKRVKTIHVNRVADINWTNFTIEDKFGYTCTANDNIQIGVSVWVKNSNNEKLYADPITIMTKPVCLLSKTLHTYIKTKTD